MEVSRAQSQPQPPLPQATLLPTSQSLTLPMDGSVTYFNAAPESSTASPDAFLMDSSDLDALLKAVTSEMEDPEQPLLAPSIADVHSARPLPARPPSVGISELTLEPLKKRRASAKPRGRFSKMQAVSGQRTTTTTTPATRAPISLPAEAPTSIAASEAHPPIKITLRPSPDLNSKLTTFVDPYILIPTYNASESGVSTSSTHTLVANESVVYESNPISSFSSDSSSTVSTCSASSNSVIAPPLYVNQPRIAFPTPAELVSQFISNLINVSHSNAPILKKQIMHNMLLKQYKPQLLAHTNHVLANNPDRSYKIICTIIDECFNIVSN